MRRLLVTLIVLTIAAFAADISGNWKGTAEGPQGALQRTFAFKVDGAKLTGDTTSEMLGKSTINEGKIDGDNISFSITANFQGNEMKMNYKGKVAGDEIQLTAELAGGGDFPPINWKLKKEK